ncbi:hypothetical protein CSC65_07095 [Pseudoxanthomonas daejeonensis]|uniref:Autotransporter domain-containing protein n=1 Tax=Pseudoxanthomonas daejeonensis TaxID=266062 RepID=A0ABQ6Z8J7_9GAMM|nr:hypothetical protein CSC65_07095 [Pseudoxanthomonas daejeonensis]
MVANRPCAGLRGGIGRQRGGRQHRHTLDGVHRHPHRRSDRGPVPLHHRHRRDRNGGDRLHRHVRIGRPGGRAGHRHLLRAGPRRHPGRAAGNGAGQHHQRSGERPAAGRAGRCRHRNHHRRRHRADGFHFGQPRQRGGERHPNLVYRVALSQPYGTALTVNFSIGGTATAGTDYAAIGASVAIPAGSTGANVTVNPTGDSTLEPHETVIITLATGSGYTVGSPASATGTILNDDSPVVNVAVAPASMAEDAGTSLVYTFTLSQPKATAVSLVYTVTGTATSGTDYVAPASPLVIPAGSTSGTIVVTPTADTAIEANETVIVTLQNGAGYTRGTTVATGTIVNDDTSTATIAVAPGAVLENGAPNLIYTVTLSQAAAVSTSVNFSVGGTATSGSDYAAVVSPLVIPAGTTTRTITVNPTADTTVEADETVVVTLAAGGTYVVGVPASATGTITNDDLPALVINDVSIVEGDSGTTNAVFTVTLSPAVGQNVSVNYATANGTASGTTDYTPTSGTVTIAAGATTGTISVPVRGDTLAEPNETFRVNLSNPVNARLADTQGVGTITDDDTRTATLALAPATVQEDGATGLVYTVTLSRPALAATTVRFTMAGTATSGTDYTAVGTSVVIPVGATTRTVTVVPIADTTVELDETVLLTLVAGTGYAVGAPASATGTIGNDDVSTATVAVAPSSVVEDSGAGLVFTVTLSQPAAAATAVDFTVGGTASAGSDYAAIGSPVIIPAGSATGTVTVVPLADTQVEPDESVVLALVPGTGYATAAPASATGTIANDDVVLASIAVSPAVVPEDGVSALVYTVTLSQVALAATAVDFSVAGTATSGADYAAVSNPVIIPAGSATGTVTVTPIADATVEADETIVLALAAGTGYSVGSPAIATGTISNLDTIRFDPATLPAATVASGYTQAIVASGGNGPYAYAVTAGALPPGLALASDGALSGTPTAGGAFAVTVTATDSLGFTESNGYVLTVNAPAIALGPAMLVDGTAGATYSQALVAGGGIAPYSYAVTAGGLPAGLTLTADGLLAGTPLADGTFNVTVTATDSSTGSGPYAASQAYALVIATTAIDAVDDAGAVANGARGGIAVADVLANDTVGGSPATLATVTLAQLSTSDPDVTLDAGSGAINVAAATGAGTYTLGYRICEARYASNCRDATVTVSVGAAVIDAADDAGSALAGTASVAVASVLANDTLDAAPATLAGVSLALVSTSDPAVTLDTVSGAVQVAASATAGAQVLAYRLCEVLNPGNCDDATATITVNAAPAAQSRELEIAADAPATVDLAEGASGGPFTAATLVALSPASAGRAVIHATGSGAAARFLLEFLPAAGFGGSARVQFTLANAFAVSPVATVTFQVQPRPDPALDPAVRGIIDAQVQSTRRFADVQGDNVRGRLESLHGSGSRQGRLDNRVGFALSRECVQQARPGEPEGQPRCERADADPGQATAPDQASGEEPARPYGAWIGGQIRSGSFDGSGGSGVSFETDGVSLGVDIDLAPAFTIGAGVGYGRDDNEIGEQGSSLAGRATSYLGYASYHPGRLFIDGLAGYQQLTFDLRRALADGGMVAGTRQGRQWFGSLILGADLPSGNGQLTPYARFDVASATLNAYGESGHATRALHFDAMDVDASTGNLGFRYDYRLATSWGTVTPQFRTEYQYDFTDPQVAAMRYADLPEGLTYRMESTRLDRRRLVFGAGVTLDWSSGLGMRLEYSTGSGDDDRRDQDVSVNLQKQF